MNTDPGNYLFNWAYDNRTIHPMPFTETMISSLILYFLYVLLYSYIYVIMKMKYSKLASVIVLVISLIDTGIREVLYSSNYVGILPSDNVVMYYISPHLKYETRISIFQSVVYFIILIAISVTILRKYIRKEKTNG